MIPCRPISVSKGAFAFCRYALAALLWLAVILRSEEIAVAAVVIMALSAILTVRWAPLVALYSYTIDRLFPAPKEVLDINAMRFAHTFGVALVGSGLALVYAGHAQSGWIFLFFVAIGKTVGALGFCAASKLYGCVNRSGGSCCRIGKKVRGLIPPE